MEDKLFTLLGLGVPFYLGAATYGLFWWLDSNASDEATKVISSWLHGRSQNKPDLGNLIISAFDRIYTSPLLSFRAFRRSAAISTAIWLFIFLVPSLRGLIRYWGRIYTGVLSAPAPTDDTLLRSIVIATIILYSILTVLLNLILTVLSDYLSLLFVRRFLKLARTYPITSSVVSSIIGVAVITISYLLWIAATMAVGIIPFLNWDISDIITEISDFVNYLGADTKRFFGLFFKLSIFVGSMGPAFIIHLWLPLFALSSLAVRLLFLTFRAIDWAQWFLKQGDAHPLKAIGIVATVIVFGSAVLVKEGWALLGFLEPS